MTKRILLEVIIIICVSAAISVIVNFLRPDSLSFFVNSEDRSAENASQEEIREISIEDAITEFENGAALFADARLPADYSKGHIRDAINLPEQQMDDWMEDFISKYEPQTYIITYCEGAHCPLAIDLAQKLYFAGYENVFYLTNGWGKWKQKKLPIEVEP